MNTNVYATHEGWRMDVSANQSGIISVQWTGRPQPAKAGAQRWRRVLSRQPQIPGEFATLLLWRCEVLALTKAD